MSIAAYWLSIPVSPSATEVCEVPKAVYEYVICLENHIRHGREELGPRLAHLAGPAPDPRDPASIGQSFHMALEWEPNV